VITGSILTSSTLCCNLWLHNHGIVLYIITLCCILLTL